MPYKIGILDQSPVFPETSPAEALEETIHLAQQAEKWGYSRFWVSEHHDTKDLAGPSPEVLVSHLLAKTNSIHVGSGGVMLRHYSPYKVAENFNLMSSLAPGRVDLGIGKAPGGLPLSTKALQYGTMNDGKDFDERLTLIKQLIKNDVPKDHLLAEVEATPKPPKEPEIFLLGGSPNSAKQAAELGIGFVFALFINSDQEQLGEAARVYRSIHPNGMFIAAVHVLAAPEQKEAEKLAENHKNIKVHLEDGGSYTVTSIRQAHNFGKQSGVSYDVEEQDANILAGTPEYVKGTLTELHQTHQIDEFILHTALTKRAERYRSFELLRPDNAADSSS